jgi:hypothetical protein
MRCGNCEGDHATVAQVRDCYSVQPEAAAPGPFIEPKGPFVELSEKQYNFINSLRIERGEKPFLDGYEKISENKSKAWAKYEIARLLAIPKTDEASELDRKIGTIPEGRYAVDSLSRANDLDFYLVEKPSAGQWAGFTFVKMIVGGKPEFSIKGARRFDVLKVIAETGWEVAAKIYSDESGNCSACGISLTKYASRQLGYGYICANKRGFGAEWTAIQNKWEADERAGLHAEIVSHVDDPNDAKRAIDDSFEATLDHDEFLRFERVAAREAADQASFSIEPPAGTPSPELTDAEEAQEAKTWS